MGAPKWGRGPIPYALCWRWISAVPPNEQPAIMKVKGEMFPEQPVTKWTAIGVDWLAGFDFEIKVIARIPA